MTLPTVFPDRYILMVDDSPIDFEIASRAFRAAHVNTPLIHCTSADEVLDLLLPPTPHDSFTNALEPYPSLILLDLNLPGTDGRMALVRLKSDEATRRIPVVVLSTSNNDSDVEYCYRLGANAYVRKPDKPDDFTKLAAAIKDFWLSSAILPDPQSFAA